MRESIHHEMLERVMAYLRQTLNEPVARPVGWLVTYGRDWAPPV